MWMIMVTRMKRVYGDSMKKRLTTDDHRNINRIADGIAKKIIAGGGIRRALLIAKAVNEKVIANYKSLKRKYPKEYS